MMADELCPDLRIMVYLELKWPAKLISPMLTYSSMKDNAKLTIIVSNAPL